jgi:hypothetical protein
MAGQLVPSQKNICHSNQLLTVLSLIDNWRVSVMRAVFAHLLTTSHKLDKMNGTSKKQHEMAIVAGTRSVSCALLLFQLHEDIGVA